MMLCICLIKIWLWSPKIMIPSAVTSLSSWIIFLIFVPFLTALIYLIARGNGMQKRGIAQAQEMRAAQDAYIRQTAGTGGGAADDIAKAKSLLDSGAITRAEFDALKAKALAA